MQTIIYGTGDYGKRLLRLFQNLGITPNSFCRTEVKDNETVENIPVVSVDNLIKTKKNLMIFIAIGDKFVRKNIKHRLRSLFLERAEIFECTELLGDDVNYTGGGMYCLLCGNAPEKFQTGGFQAAEQSKLFREHYIIGGGYRENFKCPVCGALDRERWQLYVLSNFTAIFKEPCRVLHFAPETHMEKFFIANPKLEYYTGDIVPGRAMHVTDILDIQYKDETFDYVVMNHVLEHIADIAKAMDEIRRVLKPSGKLIISFPICIDQPTMESPEIDTPEKRLEFYGQKDHVRLFGNDYIERLEEFGWRVKEFSPKDLCGKREIERYGFIEDDILMICEKRIEGVSDG